MQHNQHINMPPQRKTRQQLKKGDNMVVSIENVFQDCLIVSLIHQNKKFCGALMDTTKRDGPYGIPCNPETEEEENKMETRHSQDAPKPSYKTPFPQPLLLRKTYKQEVPQPPLRNIFRRIRRSRRKARLNILKPSREGGLKRQRGWKFLSHNVSCQCCDCIQGVQEVKPNGPGSSVKSDPKTVSDDGSTKKGVKFQNDTPSTSSDDDNYAKPIASEKLVSPIKNLIPRTSPVYKPKIQRSPVIKITYKSPGGRGRVVKIPSRIHHSPVKVDNATAKIQETSVTEENPVLNNKQLVKRKLNRLKPLSTEEEGVNLVGSAPHFLVPEKPKRGRKRKFEEDVSVHDTDNDAMVKPVEISPCTGKVKRKYVRRTFDKGNVSLRSVQTNEPASVSSSLVGDLQSRKTKQKHIDQAQSEITSAVKSETAELKQKYKKKNRKQEHAMKVLKRAKNSSFSFSVESPIFNAPIILPPLPPSPSSDPVVGKNTSAKDKHLRVILKPLDEKNGISLPLPTLENSLKSNTLPHLLPLEESEVTSSKKLLKPKTSPQPMSHTIYVTSCKNPTGIFTQGDVVWGKLSGYPWWPSRIIKLIVTKTDGKVLQQEAMVAWFRSRTTSTIPLRCVQSFEKSFTVRFEKKRKGVYRKAVDDARSALTEISPEAKKLIAQFETIH
ncbi:unnamed protein product [Clavelina lepadiformis]|uniref:PWWP domain-containing protein n=1 Tax=Clavelina lepadiformis TaxID=159417 RepID=A0ABP0GEG9_CLALP